MDDIKIIEELSNAFGPSGFEDDVVSIIKKYTKDHEVISDSLNNVFAKLRANRGNRPVIMLDAHSDELGFMVHSITANGLIKFLPLGGWAATSIPAHSVIIINSRGERIKGIIASKPPQFMSEAERKSKVEIGHMYIDVGVTSRDEVVIDFGIEIGNPVVPDVTFSYNEKNGVMRGKAFDDRIGCLCVIEVLQNLKDANLDVDVIGVFAAQEEIGARGAVVTSRVVKPDLAIVFEGPPADDVYFDQFTAQGCLKKGTQIRYFDRSMICSPNFIKYAREIAKEKDITYQCAIRKQGATNGGKIHLSNKGVPTLVLGIPVRYAHTHYCYSAKFDVETTISLAVEVIKNFTNDKIKEILKKND